MVICKSLVDIWVFLLPAISWGPVETTTVSPKMNRNIDYCNYVKIYYGRLISVGYLSVYLAQTLSVKRLQEVKLPKYVLETHKWPYLSITTIISQKKFFKSNYWPIFRIFTLFWPVFWPKTVSVKKLLKVKIPIYETYKWPYWSISTWNLPIPMILSRFSWVAALAPIWWPKIA